MELTFWWERQTVTSQLGSDEGHEEEESRVRRLRIASRSEQVCQEEMLMQRFQWRQKEQDFRQRAAWPQGPWGRKKLDAGSFISSTGQIVPNYHYPHSKTKCCTDDVNYNTLQKSPLFSPFLKVSEKCSGTRRGTKLEVRKLLAIRLNSRYHHFVPNLNLC